MNRIGQYIIVVYNKRKGLYQVAKIMGVHETLEVHELLTFKNLCLTKSVTMSGLAQDEELKSILSQAITTDQQNIKDLQGFLS